MKSKSVFKKLAMFVVILALVLSVAGTAFAHGGPPNPPAKPDTVTIIYDLGDGESFTDIAAVANKDTQCPTATFILKDATKAGFELLGWWGMGKPGDEKTVGVEYNWRENKWNNIRVCAQWIRVEETALYNVIYTGTFADGALFWPDDVENATTPPVISGVPYRAGYYFTGWRPGTLDWAKADVAVDEKIINPHHGPCYLVRTITYTIRVQGSFSLEPVTTVPTVEIPVAAPQTGGMEWAGIAGALAVLSAMGIALVARRRNGA